MPEPLFHPGPRGSQAPSSGTPPIKTTLVRREAGDTDTKLFPEGTCTSCKVITLQNLLRTRAEKTICFSLDRDKPTECPSCRMIFSSIDPGNAMTGNIVVRVSASYEIPHSDDTPQIHCVFLEGFEESWLEAWPEGALPRFKRLRIYAEPGSYACKFTPCVRAPLSNLSDTTFQRITSWIKDCDETHESCRGLSPPFDESTPRCLPSRVVHVGSATQQPHLHIPPSQQIDRYTALSHCWGKLAQAKTLKSNIERFREVIVFDTLSKTFQDAISVTRRLGIDYIWIDSLCIVQDDEDDWLQESENMGSIYTNAWVTVAATSATDGSGGLDSVRPMSNWARFPCDVTDETKGHMWLTDGSWSTRSDLDEAPLNARGWVFQEKVLSRRIIHFTFSQVYWECKKCLVAEECEDLRRRFECSTYYPLDSVRFWANVNTICQTEPILVQRANNGRKSGFPRWESEIYIPWRDLIYYYCTKNFTKQSDRLTALLGIIRIIEKQTGLRCVDGHWVSGSWSFVRELLWFLREPRTLSVLDDGRRSRLCSSWSWASLEGPANLGLTDDLDDRWDRYDLKNCDLRLQAIEDKVQVHWRKRELSHLQEPYISWPCHPLKVSGMLRPFHKGELIDNEDGDEYEYPQYRERSFVVKAEVTGVAYGRVGFHCEYEEPEEFHLCSVYLGELGIVCLALVERKRPGSKEPWFERVGTGYTRNNAFQDCRRETYYII